MEQQLLTIVIPNRNRDLKTVRRSLDSIQPQLGKGVELWLVDYGSSLSYQDKLQTLLLSFPKVRILLCPVQGQLWNKSRCINMILKEATSTYFMVCDMDMIWHPRFLDEQSQKWQRDQANYYSVGMLTEEESQKNQKFDDYAISFKSSREATGITVFDTEALKSINGFDEFYHGWGAEDTDAHDRFKNAGFKVKFESISTYFLHQWHLRDYRSTISFAPFHKYLERINDRYSEFTRDLNRIKANEAQEWGVMCGKNAYEMLQSPDIRLEVKPFQHEIIGIVNQLLEINIPQTVHITVQTEPLIHIMKARLKSIIGKGKPSLYMSMEHVNERFLEMLVSFTRNHPYKYKFDRQKRRLDFIIRLNNHA
ncbi:Glycosyl transferase family 2 [Nonlabens sp. Hel1_33_55]|uniref:glycosyltransferase family 2 protein n=1 Tax=Nonlabens sp. Hel1_33_55 TaxID=1336802 RepID=UPI000875AE99|nr:galactosyltransferase-related protein [Nonlabens sp. Hel1_33_55]SCX92409.1 Glycosyl transferase family 2 [Nonlabens sp. Hel1_33_55]